MAPPKHRPGKRKEIGMTEMTFTKGDLMAAYSKMRQPQIGDKNLPSCDFNDTLEADFAFLGAEVLIDAIENPSMDVRKELNARVVKRAEERNKRDVAKRLHELLDLFDGGTDIVAEAERITTPPRGE